MIAIILGSFLALLSLIALALQRLYSSVPVHELRRLSQRGDELARQLYRAASFGASLRVLLWCIAGTCLAGASVLWAQHLPAPVAVCLLSGVLFAALVVAPSTRLTVHTAQATAAVAPLLAHILHLLHPALHFLARHINRTRDLTPHSRFYEK